MIKLWPRIYMWPGFTHVNALYHYWKISIASLKMIYWSVTRNSTGTISCGLEARGWTGCKMRFKPFTFATGSIPPWWQTAAVLLPPSRPLRQEMTVQKKFSHVITTARRSPCIPFIRGWQQFGGTEEITSSAFITASAPKSLSFREES